MRKIAPVEITPAAAAQIARRHGLRDALMGPLPSTGIINTVHSLGERHVLRVPRDHPLHIAQAVKEAAAIPLAVAAGVRTPRLVAFDDSLETLPVPYLIVERIAGADAETLGPSALRQNEPWRELGHDLARLHMLGAVGDGTGVAINATPKFGDPRELVQDRVADGWLSAVEAQWMQRWLDRIASRATRKGPARLLHGDVQMSNVLLDPGTLEYLALIDWGCAQGDEIEYDFLGFPMHLVPSVLDGYRDESDMSADDEAEVRIVWRRLQMILTILPRGSAPGCGWGERPVAWLADLLKFLATTGLDEWRSLGPT